MTNQLNAIDQSITYVIMDAPGTAADGSYRSWGAVPGSVLASYLRRSGGGVMAVPADRAPSADSTGMTGRDVDRYADVPGVVFRRANRY